MKAIKYSAFRKRLRQHLDECEETGEPVLVESINNKMIVISKARYDEIIKPTFSGALFNELDKGS